MTTKKDQSNNNTELDEALAYRNLKAALKQTAKSNGESIPGWFTDNEKLTLEQQHNAATTDKDTEKRGFELGARVAKANQKNKPQKTPYFKKPF
ncbi:hypothetical protein ACFQ22_13070 [Lentilactobacillus raoultii]|uniref:Uncharacterized protein n=1 Tax=Lentilactobacillus raoultii TaxID=1987503 RepID=A0ABW3PJV3_9LACO|nr:hypothetical protein [Lentilactobacillus raoultii]